MGIFKKIQEMAERTKQDIEKGTSDALMQEELDPTLRQHHGEPIRKPKPPKEGK